MPLEGRQCRHVTTDVNKAFCGKFEVDYSTHTVSHCHHFICFPFKMSSNSTTPSKRSRKCNWSLEELVFIMELYKDRKHILKGNFGTNGCNNTSKLECWDKILSELSQAFPAGNRTVRECQKRYHTSVMNAKPKIAGIKQDFASTCKRVAHII